MWLDRHCEDNWEPDRNRSNVGTHTGGRVYLCTSTKLDVARRDLKKSHIRVNGGQSPVDQSVMPTTPHRTAPRALSRRQPHPRSQTSLIGDTLPSNELSTSIVS
ncbi:hypothetical protein LZ30DRAFT_683413 [Colletotrichum cereale]|nr:hypothetical protein LZ30DRAFT_683413 [Colletotrichum cereale]